MNSQTLEALIAWVGQHPISAGVVIFLIAFCDALVILGFLVPAIPLLFAIGAFIGLGTLDGPYAIVCAALGAFCGDGLSYVVGRRYGDRLRTVWPFSRYPQWLPQGEAMFRRHGVKSIVIARFVGAVRPLVPAIAGMLAMPVRRYALPSLVASVLWSATCLVPGWIFGKSVELLAAVAGPLAIVVAALLALLALIYFTVDQAYRFFAPRTSLMLSRVLVWSHRHPVLGRMSEALIDPRRRESPSLLLLAILLIGGGWAFFTLLLMLAGNGDPTSLDLAVHHAMFGLRTPLADASMAFLASLGDWEVLLPATLIAAGWLLWRRRFIAAAHLAGAYGFGLALVWALDALVHVPRPPAAMDVAGFDFPAAQVTMAVMVYGFFAVRIARDLPGRARAWPYGIAAVLVTLVAFGRLYLGAHWLSDVLAGVFLGMAFIAALGLAYRRRATRSFWMRPLALLFYGTVTGFAIWHGQHDVKVTLERFAPPQVQADIDAAHWWNLGWETLPKRRNEFLSERAWPLNVQYAGSLDTLRRALENAGWSNESESGLPLLLRSLDKTSTPKTLPVLPASHNGLGDALRMTVAGPDEDTRLMLHLWPAPLRLQGSGTSVWQGTVAVVKFEQRWSIFRYWRLQAPSRPALETLSRAVPELMQKQTERGTDAGAVLLLRDDSGG